LSTATRPGLAPAGDLFSLLVQRKEAKKAPWIFYLGWLAPEAVISSFRALRREVHAVNCLSGAPHLPLARVAGSLRLALA